MRIIELPKFSTPKYVLFYQDPKSCCHYFDQHGKCREDLKFGCKLVCDPKTDEFNCTVPVFMRASMMNVDIGLFAKFDVSTGDKNGVGHGRPTGCTGLNRESWLANERLRPGTVHVSDPLPTFDEANYLDYSSKHMPGKMVANARFSDVVAGQQFSGCPLNMDLAENGQEMHQIVQEYGRDNNLFVRDFSAVFQKMIENGYQAGNSNGNDQLKPSNWQWVNLRCNSKTCWPFSYEF